jgi:hypothetical protein
MVVWSLVGLLTVGAVAIVSVRFLGRQEQPRELELPFAPRRPLESSGFIEVSRTVPGWPASASFDEIAGYWRNAGHRLFRWLERSTDQLPAEMSPVDVLVIQALALNYEGEATAAYKLLEKARPQIERGPWAHECLDTIIYFQGVLGLPRGETENCIQCRGENSCILSVARSAIHTNPEGSRLAIHPFTEYLERFPDDLGVRWLLNLAHMTLGEYPNKVDPRYLVSLDHFNRSEHGIGKFRDVGQLVGLARFNQAGGAILEDFDNDGLLDVFVSTMSPTDHVAFYRNRGDGTFEDRTGAARLTGQLGGL